MTVRRATALVMSWVRFYTRQLPAAIAERRVAEINADLHDHITYEQARGTGDRRIALGVLSRMVRGLAADASWRNRIRPWRGDIMKSSAAKLAAAVALAAVGVLAFLYGGYDDSPGLQLIGVLLVVGALTIGYRTARRARSTKL
jgi:peptidoglycan/LPS O-acetylase OafA/YrhL